MGSTSDPVPQWQCQPHSTLACTGPAQRPCTPLLSPPPHPPIPPHTPPLAKSPVSAQPPALPTHTLPPHTGATPTPLVKSDASIALTLLSVNTPLPCRQAPPVSAAQPPLLPPAPPLTLANSSRLPCALMMLSLTAWYWPHRYSMWSLCSDSWGSTLYSAWGWCSRTHTGGGGEGVRV